MSNKVSKPVKQAPGTLTVFDEELNDFIEVDYETQRLAAYVHQHVVLGAFTSAIGIKKIFDEKLYRGLGCSSRENYIYTMTDYSKSQAYKLYAIASKLDEVGKSINGGESPLLITEGGINVQSTGLTEVMGMGIEKLYKLVRGDDEELKSLVKTGKMNLDGNEITIEEIKEMSAREVSKLVSEQKKKFTAKITQLDEKVKKLSLEQKENEKLIKELTEENEHAQKIEKTLGPVAARIKDKAERLAEARKLLDEFVATFVRCGVTDEDPEELQSDVTALIKKIDETAVKMRGNFSEVIRDEF